jgi:hypothetical protein
MAYIISAQLQSKNTTGLQVTIILWKNAQFVTERYCQGNRKEACELLGRLAEVYKLNLIELLAQLDNLLPNLPPY